MELSGCKAALEKLSLSSQLYGLHCMLLHKQRESARHVAERYLQPTGSLSMSASTF